MTIRIFLLTILSIALAGCSDRKPNRHLTTVEELASVSPYKALDSLDAIDPTQLSESDRHYYDFLSVKVADKAYVTHSSDSLILSVIDYESTHQGNGRYPESLYYGGRVYSDLGDYPTALNYFQLALDKLTEGSYDLKLRRVVLSQIGRLLNKLRLYEQAIPYVESALSIDCRLNDSINEIYNLQLLGGIYMRAHDYKGAEHYFSTALRKSQNLHISHRAKSAMFLAAAKHYSGQIDSALLLIRGTPDLVKPLARNSALAYAAGIYRTAGILDTAYMYAHELINSHDETNRENGYDIILSPEIRKDILPDTILRYINEYRDILENYFDENENQLAINQQSYYNYQLHERERTKAEESKEIMRQWIIAFSFIVMLLTSIILFLKNRNKNNIIELHAALENMGRLEYSLNKESDSTPIKSNESIHELRERLRDKLYALYNSSSQPIAVPTHILHSEAYRKLQELIASGKVFKESNNLWKELEDVVISCSPHFKKNLLLLVGGKLTSYDLHTSLLIKCGVSPTQMTVLLNRTKGTIVSRRESLCIRVFGKKLGTKVIDGIIRLL